MSRIHLSLPNAYKLMCFVRNINGNRDVRFLECDYLLVQRCMKLTLEEGETEFLHHIIQVGNNCNFWKLK